VLAKRGYRLGLLARSEAVEALAGELGGVAVRGSVASGEDLARLVDAAMAKYGRAVTLMGPAGSGQLTKMVNQITVVGLVQALAEGLNFAVHAGLDAKKVVEVISKGAAQSWQLENRGPTMLDDKFDFGFAVDWMRKDLQICLDEARRNGALLPLTAQVKIQALETDKRPVSAVADFTEVREVVTVEIHENRDVSMTLLFDVEANLEERVFKEQFLT